MNFYIDGSDEAGCSGSHEHSEIVTLRPPKDLCPVNHWRCNSGKFFIQSFGKTKN